MSYTIRSNIQINVPPTSNVVAPFSGYDVTIGGGGFVRNLTIHSDGTMIGGVDVYAGYIRSTVAGGQWRNLCTANSLPSSITGNFFCGAGVIGASMYAGNSSTILMGYKAGDPRIAYCLLSLDKGYTFKIVFGQYYCDPNGGAIGDGGTQPMMAIDPNNSNCAFIGTRNGLFFTSNLLGTTPTWTPVKASNFTVAVVTSTQTLTPGVQTITIPGSFNYSLQPFIFYETSNPNNWMQGWMDTGGNGNPITLNVTSFGGSGSHSDWTLAFNCVGCIAYDPNSGTNGSGFTNKVVVCVQGSGLWYTTDGGTTWTGPIATSSQTPNRAYMNTDGTYWLTDYNTNTINRLTSGNVFTSIGAGGTNYVICADPVNPSRVIGDHTGSAFAGDGHFYISNNGLAGSPTFNSNAGSRLLSPAGQPGWISDSNDQYLTAGQWLFDPLTGTSATSLTISGNSYTFTDIPLGLNIVVGDFMRFSQTSAIGTNTICGIVTNYSSGNLTIKSNQTTSTTSQVSSALGSLSFSVPSGMSFVVGAQIHVGRTSDLFTYFSGFVTSYSGTTLVINVTDSGQGSGGTFTDWTIEQGTQRGSGTISNWTYQKERLWFAMGIGVLYTDYILDGSRPCQFGCQFWNSDTLGIENLVANRVVWPPGGNPFGCCWDRPYWYLANPNTPKPSYHPAYGLVSGKGNNVQFGQAVNYATGLTTFICGVDEEFGGGYSTDGGITWINFSSIPPTIGLHSGGEIASPDGTKLFYMAGGAGGLYYSANLGVSWTESFCSGVPPGPQTSLSTVTAAGSGNKSFTLSPPYTTIGALAGLYVAGTTLQIQDSSQTAFMTGTVVSYTAGTGVLVIAMNALSGSGTFSNWTIYTSNIGWTPGGFTTDPLMLAPDRVNSLQMHVFNTQTGYVYKSTDGGQTFAKGTNPVPFGSAQLKSVRQLGASTNTTGHLFACNQQFGNAPQRSTDGGNTWSAVHANVTMAWAFGSGAPNPAGSMTYPAIYMFGVLTTGAAGSLPAFYRSDDNCVTWNYICTYLPRDNVIAGLGGWVDDVQCMEGNPSRWNSFIVGYQGSGYAYWGPSSGY
jgi:hypothetical protein